MRSRPRASGKPSIQPWIGGAVALAVAGGLAAAIVWRSGRENVRTATSAARAQAAKSSPPAPASADWALPDDLPPLPPPSEPLPRPAVVVRAAYESAARHPELLAQLPCFCGCRKLGHRSNHDCFVSSRDSSGRVAWDRHGMG